jgi:hypothetical protein
MPSRMWIHSSVKFNALHENVSEASPKFDQDAMLRFALDRLPTFTKNFIWSQLFDQQSTKYNIYL